MRLSLRVALALVLGRAARAVVLSSEASSPPPPAYPIGAVAEPFAKPSGRLFDINGTVGYFAGVNAWWLGHLTNNSDVDMALKQIKDSGFKVVRVWGFGDVTAIPKTTRKTVDPSRVWYQLLNTTGGYINYGPDGLQRLDYVISASERLGLKLVVPFTNNWGDWGGIDMYWGVYDPNYKYRSWYEIPQAQAVYRAYVSALVARYRNSSAIFSWQLMNEPRCEGCDNSVITGWATNTSRLIKSIDPGHMVSMGDEGWLLPEDVPNGTGPGYAGQNGLAWADNLANISTIDYGTFHLYPATWNLPAKWGNDWILEHDAIGAKIGKPVVLEEYGTPHLETKIAEIAPWQATVLQTGIAGDQFWQFGPANLSVNTAPFGDDFSIYINKPEFAQLGLQHALDMASKKVSTWRARRSRLGRGRLRGFHSMQPIFNG